MYRDLYFAYLCRYRDSAIHFSQFIAIGIAIRSYVLKAGILEQIATSNFLRELC